VKGASVELGQEEEWKKGKQITWEGGTKGRYEGGRKVRGKKGEGGAGWMNYIEVEKEERKRE